MLSIPAVLRSAERGIFGDAWAFTRAAGGGFVDAGVNAVKGLGSLAKGGYKLVTDSQTREKAWDTANEVAGRAKDYGSKVVDDPGKPFRDARDGATSMSNAFKEARDKAAAEGRSAEFWGGLTGSGVFEVGSMLIPVGAASKLGKVGKIADAGADTAKALDKAGDLGKAAKGFPDSPPCAVEKCPKSGTETKAGPTEAYNRQKHYGKTPTQADRKALGVRADEVADHQPSLVERYYQGDPSIGEPPGYTMTPAERKASAGDRNRMAPQPKAESNAQGAEKARYSREQKKKHGL